MPNQDTRPAISGEHLRALVWLDHRDSHFVHLTITDERLHLPGSSKQPGLHLGFNDNPRSANYNPVALARCLEAMRRCGWEGLPLHEDLFIRPRHLNRRDEIIEEYERFHEVRVPVQSHVWIRQSQADEFQREFDALCERFA